MVKLSSIDANDFIQEVTLDKTAYKLHYSWNDYAQQWTLGIRTAQGDDIVRGIAIVPNYPLLMGHHRTANLPRGEFMAVVVDADNADNQTIGRDGFTSGRFSMVYIPEVEIDGIRNAK